MFQVLHRLFWQHPGELVGSLLLHDEYLVLADYQSCIDCQDRVSRAFCDPEKWTRMSILNVARMGKFSSEQAPVTIGQMNGVYS
jgi:glucan phosphorylase